MIYLTISQLFINQTILYNKEIKAKIPSYIKEHLTLILLRPFKQKLNETEWNNIKTLQNPNVVYKIFLQKFDT